MTGRRPGRQQEINLREDDLRSVNTIKFRKQRIGNVEVAQRTVMRIVPDGQARCPAFRWRAVKPGKTLEKSIVMPFHSSQHRQKDGQEQGSR